MTEKDSRQFNGRIEIGDLYPELSPEQQAEAEYHLLRYLALVKRIFERIALEKPELLTKLEHRAMLRKVRMSSTKRIIKNKFFKL